MVRYVEGYIEVFMSQLIPPDSGLVLLLCVSIPRMKVI